MAGTRASDDQREQAMVDAHYLVGIHGNMTKAAEYASVAPTSVRRILAADEKISVNLCKKLRSAAEKLDQERLHFSGQEKKGDATVKNGTLEHARKSHKICNSLIQELRVTSETATAISAIGFAKLADDVEHWRKKFLDPII